MKSPNFIKKAQVTEHGHNQHEFTDGLYKTNQILRRDQEGITTQVCLLQEAGLVSNMGLRVCSGNLGNFTVEKQCKIQTNEFQEARRLLSFITSTFDAHRFIQTYSCKLSNKQFHQLNGVTLVTNNSSQTLVFSLLSTLLSLLCTLQTS